MVKNHLCAFVLTANLLNAANRIENLMRFISIILCNNNGTSNLSIFDKSISYFCPVILPKKRPSKIFKIEKFNRQTTDKNGLILTK